MSSGAVARICGTRQDRHLHVGFDPHSGRWWAVQGDSSFGGSLQRSEAVSMAIDAKRSMGLSGEGVHIIVHKRGGAVDFRITKCPGKPSPQFFQDSAS